MAAQLARYYHRTELHHRENDHMAAPGFRSVDIREETRKLVEQLTAIMQKSNYHPRRIMICDAIHIALQEAIARRRPRRRK